MLSNDRRRAPARPIQLARPAGAPGLWQLPSRLLARLWQMLLLWQERASSRHRLSLMSEHELKDIGVTRLAAEGEINKPFWRG